MNDNDLVKFHVPASFVMNHVALRARELAYGFKHGWLTAADAVQLVIASLEAGAPLSQCEEEIALLRPTELGQMPFLIDELERVSAKETDPAAVWLFLALAWIYGHRTSFYDPLGMIEMLYADFGYPDEIKRFVRFMPASPGLATGLDAIAENWRAYVEKKTEEYRTRTRRPQG
jgi:hypothetical protein